MSTSVTPASAGGLDGLVGVDGGGDPGRARPGHGTQPLGRGADHLVGEQQVVAEPGGGHALHLPDGGAAERGVARRRRAAGRAPWT